MYRDSSDIDTWYPLSGHQIRKGAVWEPGTVLCLLQMWRIICRYSRLADWGYIATCAEAAAPLPLIGNGDVFSFTEYEDHMSAFPQLATTMLARGALIKPWLFTEVSRDLPGRWTGRMTGWMIRRLASMRML